MAERTDSVADRLDKVEKELELIRQGLYILSGANSGYLQHQEIFALFKDLLISHKCQEIERF